MPGVSEERAGLQYGSRVGFCRHQTFIDNLNPTIVQKYEADFGKLVILVLSRA